MSGDRLTLLILTTVFLAVYSASSAVDRSKGVADESVNGTRKMAANDASVKVTAEVVERSKVNEPVGTSTEKPSTVENREEKGKNTKKSDNTEAQSGEDNDEAEAGEDDYYDDPTSNKTNIVSGPCAPGMRRDSNGICRQDL